VFLNACEAKETEVPCTRPHLVALTRLLNAGKKIDDVIAELERKHFNFMISSKEQTITPDFLRSQVPRNLYPLEVVVGSKDERTKWWQHFRLVEKVEFIVTSFDEIGRISDKRYSTALIGPSVR
jgi:hypothetical protein